MPSGLALVQLGLFLGTFYLCLDTVGLDDDDDDDDDDDEVTISQPHFPKRTKIFSKICQNQDLVNLATCTWAKD